MKIYMVSLLHRATINESKHSDMGPVRQNPIQRTVSLFICVCIALCTIVAHNIAQTPTVARLACIVSHDRTNKHRNRTSEFFRLNIRTSDIGGLTRIGRTLELMCIICCLCVFAMPKHVTFNKIWSSSLKCIVGIWSSDSGGCNAWHIICCILSVAAA